MICPFCNRDSLSVDASLELPADQWSDEITVQTARCRHCDREVIAVYEESRRGSLDSESWSHRYYVNAREDVRTVADGIAACPNPASARCPCPVHRLFGKCDERGEWTRLRDAGIDLEDGGPIRSSR